MMQPLTASQSRALAIGLLLLVIGVLIAALLALVSRNHSNQQVIGELHYRLGYYQRMAGQRTALEAELAKLRKDEPTRGFYLKGGTSALAAAELQDYATAVIEAAGGRLVSIQPIADKDTKQPRRVRIQVQMNSDVAALRQILHRLEYGIPALFIDDIRVMKAHGVRPSTAATQNAGDLNVYFTLTGFLMGTTS